MSEAALPRSGRGDWRVSAQTLVNGLFFLFVLCGAIAVVEPSPYDFVSLIAIPVWFACGFRIKPMFAPFFLLATVYMLSGFIALIPYWNERDPVTFELQSLYLYFTAVFFALFFAERTTERAELCLKAFAASTVIASLAAVAGYFDIGGSSAIFMEFQRATGTFKDPNVLGSYLIMGALYCMQLIMLRRTRHMIAAACVLLLDLVGILLSFSRGSWGAFVIASALMIALALVTNPSRKARLQIFTGVLIAAFLLLVLLAALMSIDSVRELALQRAQPVGDEYDDRRFMNQFQSLPMLLERPLGFGPLRFRLFFDIEPHSSFVNAFASYGWLGGFSFIVLVLVTTFVGFRLCFARSPYRTVAQVFWPALFAFFLQGFQIDIDHWRHVFLMLGAVWGLEAARRDWLDHDARRIVRPPAAIASA